MGKEPISPFPDWGTPFKEDDWCKSCGWHLCTFCEFCHAPGCGEGTLPMPECLYNQILEEHGLADDLGILANAPPKVPKHLRKRKR